ncbi:hypothetical protein ABBQ32_010189 [Trebouxia sp. C0010 RCD-2024]
MDDGIYVYLCVYLNIKTNALPSHHRKHRYNFATKTHINIATMSCRVTPAPKVSRCGCNNEHQQQQLPSASQSSCKSLHSAQAGTLVSKAEARWSSKGVRRVC